LSCVDQAVAFDPGSQKFPDHPLTETQQVASNDGYLFALLQASHC
jgi:hypothetical protein